jgi:homogentisate phytyltransferase/homogentisate geranylgeranyltransferase
VIALGVAGLQGRYLFTAIAVIFVIGTLYSLPPLRLKRFPVLAAASIVIARAVVGNIGVYLTYSSALTGHAALTSAVLLLVGFLVGYAVVIAVMKDIPDVDGDREHGVATFVLSIGPARTLLACKLVLSACYLGIIAAALVGVPGMQPAVLIVTHVGALAVVWIAGAKVDGSDRGAVVRYYMLIWKLFYLEFAAIPLAALLGS